MADKMMKVAGRGTDGLAKPIKTDTNGSLIVVAGKKTENVVYHQSNPQTGKNSTDYAIRDTITRLFELPQIQNGITEQTINIKNDTDQPINLHIYVNAQWDVAYQQQGPWIWSYLDHQPIAPGGRVFFVPERGLYINNNSQPTRLIYALPELRQAHWAFSLEVKAATAPTTGQLVISSVRKYG